MPIGQFKSALDGNSFWTNAKCLFADRRAILDADGLRIGGYKLITVAGDRSLLWDLMVEGRPVRFPALHVNNTDYPFSLDITSGETTVAVIHSGTTSYSDYSLEFNGKKYLWKDVSKVRKVMQLELDSQVYARAHSEGLLVNQTFIEVKRDLPLDIICLLFCMFGGMVRHLTA